MSFSLICLDADDTLWHHETFFREAQGRFSALLAAYASPERLVEELEGVERRNLSLYGYGAKGFTLSMLETALAVSGGSVTGPAMAEILALGRTLMRHPIETLEGVEPVIEALAARGRLVLVTKGDLFLQEAKLAASGLGSLFHGVEIVSEKSADTYRRIFARYGVAPHEAVMAGNSVRSDVLPSLEAGAYAALVPYPLVWSHEVAAIPEGQQRFRELTHLNELPSWLTQIEADQPGP